MPVLDDSDLDAALERLANGGTQLLLGSIVDMSGVARAKAVQLARAPAFHRSGMGASPTWNVFCIDNAIAFTEQLGVVGDMRLRADLAAARSLGDGLAWAPAEQFDQHGAPLPGCARGRLRAVAADASARGLTVLLGCELEFVITAVGGGSLPTDQWQAYGLGAAVTYERFLIAVSTALDDAGIGVEQLHAEYAGYQFEVSLAPAAPLEAADQVVLARLIVCRVARAHGLLASFSPLPFAGGAGSGAHQHLSLLRDGAPLFDGGDGPYGLTDDGAAAIAGLVAGLPESLAVFAGSLLSSFRLQPGHWSGAFACWGQENREAAVRFCAATPGNPHGANVELKCIDPSGNPYLTAATMLGLCLYGIDERLALPPEVDRDPAQLSESEAQDSGVVALADSQAAAVDLLRESQLTRQILGADIVDALIAVRDYEARTYAGQDVADLTERFRFAWSV